MHTSVEPENFADLASRARLLWVSSGGWDANRVLWFLTGCGDGDLGGKINGNGILGKWKTKKSIWSPRCKLCLWKFHHDKGVIFA